MRIDSLYSKYFQLALAVCCLLSCVLNAAFAAEVRGIRVWKTEQHTRAVIELSEASEYKVFALENPARLVLDLRNVRAAKNFDVDAKGAITGLRSGTPNAGELRIVFDLTGKVRTKTFLMKPSASRHRLVLDLYPEQNEAVAATPAPVRRAAEQTGQARNVVVVIDAGHGGKDPGSIGPKGTYEKLVALKVAQNLAQRINNEPGMEAVLTRNGDRFIALEQRFEIARKAKADLFISIHADAFELSSVAGSSVFVLSQRGASSEASRYLADRENRSDLVGGVSLDDKDATLAAVLLDLSQTATQEASSAAAAQVLQSLKRFGKTHKRYVEHANFVVLRSPDVPSMLIETGFISNPIEEANLNSVAHRSKLADAILDGVRGYFQTSPPPGTWLAAHSPKRSTRAIASVATEVSVATGTSVATETRIATSNAAAVSGARDDARSVIGVRRHRVNSGETLSDIAVKHGISLARLRQANGIRGNMLRAGKVLKIPVPGATP